MTAYSLDLVQICGEVKLDNEDVIVYLSFRTFFSKIGHLIVLISGVVFYVCFWSSCTFFTGFIYDTKIVLY